MSTREMRYASTTSKVLPLVCLTVALSTSLTLFIIRDRTYIGTLPNLLKTYRNEAQVTVQVLSSVLSLAQMLVLTSLINFAARIKLFESATSIGSLGFWSALSIPRFDITLPPVKLLLVTLTLGLGTVLGALWAGSLTLLSVTVSESDGQVPIPLFNFTLQPTMYAAAGNGTIVLQCMNNQTADPRGPSYPPLDNCILMSKLPNLIMKAATATNITNPGQHPKIDNSTWIYRGRSYGKGSLAGLFDVIETKIDSKDLGFSYQEPGYSTEVNCSRQEKAVFPFQQVNNSTDPGQLILWSSNTVVLGSNVVPIPSFYLASPTYNQFNSHTFGYFAWTAFSTNSTQNYLATSSQPNSWSMDGPGNILCQIQFVPMVFDVNVSKVEQFITVTPLERIENFNQTGNIADMIIIGLDLVSRMSSSSLAYSSLFNAIGSNQKAALLAYDGIDNETAWAYSLQDAVSSIADDLLAYQGILAVSDSDSKSVRQPVRRYFAAVRVGQTSYQTAQLVINVILCAVYLWEAFRTRWWKHLPEFDFLNIKSLTLAFLNPQRSSKRIATGFKSRLSLRWTGYDCTKLQATYDEQSRLRFCVSDDSEEHQSLTFTAEQSLYRLEDLDLVQNKDRVSQSDTDLEFSYQPNRSLATENRDDGLPEVR